MNLPTANLQFLRLKAGLAAGDTSKDAAIQVAADATLAFMEAYCDRKFEYAPQTEVFTHITGDTVSLIRYPVDHVISVNRRSGSVPKYHIDKNTGLIFFDGALAVHQLTVAYEGGFNPLPDDLWGVFYDVWANIFPATDDPTKGYGAASAGGVKAVAAGDLRITYDTGVSMGGSAGGGLGGILSPFAATVLDLYKREKA
jgi:hypothetical protein